MKLTKIISLLLAVLLAALPLVSCNNNSGETKESGSESTSTETVDIGPSPIPSDFTLSSYIDGNGYWTDITAKDCVTLNEYNAIKIPASEVEVTDKEVTEELELLLEEFVSTVKTTDREVKDKDTVNIDYVGSIDGVEFDGGNTNGAGTNVTIGVTSYIDDFLEQLIGHMPGETFNVEVTFPEDYSQASLQGKDAVFVTTINHIVEKKLPELTDDFVKNKFEKDFGVTTADELNNYISSSLYEYKLSTVINETIFEKNTVETIPEKVYNHCVYYMLFDLQDQADYYGMSVADLFELYGYSSYDEAISDNKETNTKYAKVYLICQAIAEEISLVATEDDVDKYFEEVVGVDDYSDYVDVFGMPYLKMVVLNELVIEYCMDNAVIE